MKTEHAVLGCLGALLSLWACSKSDRPPTPPLPDAGADGGGAISDGGEPPALTEAQLRASLGIPPGAQKVIIFGQAAHLDVDWQETFEGYYQSYVQSIFTEARGILDDQPDAFYSVTEMSYLKHHLEAHPEERAPLQAHAARGALHIVGGGMTSPDTVLPETEMLFRDYLYGTLFAEETFGIRPHTAFLPDSFGHSERAPDVLAAAGFDSVGMGRVDGSPTTPDVILDPPLGPPAPQGSTAAMLSADGSADFVWRGAGGGQVLAHWMPGNIYCEGDAIDYQNDIQLPGGHLGTYDVQPSFVDGQIDGYVKAFSPTATTPYLYVAVGCDFQHPKPDLLSDLATYNQLEYPDSGVWAVAAPFDDYERLVAFHAAALPTLQRDLTPVYTGFYGSRADLKRGTRDAARPFFEAEIYATALGAAGTQLMTQARPAFELLTRTDHHDFVTGTSADTVVASEELPLLQDLADAGQALLRAVTQAVAERIPATPDALAQVVVFNPSDLAANATVDVTLPWTNAPPALAAHAGSSEVPLEVLASGDGGTRVRMELEALPPFGWRTVDVGGGSAAAPQGVSLQLLDAAGQPATGAAIRRVVLSSPLVRAQWDLSDSFLLTSLRVNGNEALAAPSFGITDYADQGGLWRLGNEMFGCSLTALPNPLTPDGGSETVEVLDQSSLSATVAFVSSTATREVRLDWGDLGLRLALTTGAAQGTTRTATFHFATPPGASLRTSQAGGYVDRPVERLFSPTFWPAVDWASDGDWAVLLRQSTGVHFDGRGSLELMAARDARHEQCDVLGWFLGGSDTGSHRLEWYVTPAPSPASAARSAQAFNRPAIPVLLASSQSPPQPFPPETSLASTEGEGILSALKPSERGSGDILRALVLSGPVTVRLGPLLQGRGMVKTDALERDLSPLGTSGGSVTLDASQFGSIATVRLSP